MRYTTILIILSVTLLMWNCETKKEDVSQSNDYMVDLLNKQHAKVNPLEITYYFNEKRAQAYDSLRNAKGLPKNEYISYTYWFIRETLNSGKTEKALELIGNIDWESKNIQLDDQWQYFFKRLEAVSFIRLGEQTNCLINHTAASCIVPVSGDGIHIDPMGSTRAIEIIEDLLKDYPEDLELVWLLNLCYQTIGEYPKSVPKEFLIAPKTFQNNGLIPRFQDKAPGLGIAVMALAGGSVLEDFNNDGYLDVVATSSGFTANDQMKFFVNNGDGTFTDQTEAAGLIGLVGGLNCQQTDYNNDGLMDIFVLRGGWFEMWGKHPNSLLRNNGDGTFTDVTNEAGLLSLFPSQSAAWADYNNDGWLDVFIANESAIPPGMRKNSDKRRIHRTELYINQGDGTFKNLAEEKGLDFIEFAKGTTAFDMNNDNLMDIYISVSQGPNKLLLNKGSLNFEEVTINAGVAGPKPSFPVGSFDYDNDGFQDLLVAGYTSTSLPLSHEFAHEILGNEAKAALPKLYRNKGDGTFEDVTESVNLNHTMYAMGFNYGDLNNDGYLDLYFGTGDPQFESIIPNRMFLNMGGEYFEEVSYEGGFSNIQKGHGVSWGDIDNDGDEDIYITMGGAHEGDTYQNQLLVNPTKGKNWIRIQLKGTESNTAAIGTKVHLTTSDGQEIYRTVSQGASFGANSFRLEIGLNQAEKITQLEVLWPTTGDTQIFDDILANQAIQITEGEKSFDVINPNKIDLDATMEVDHMNHMN